MTDSVTNTIRCLAADTVTKANSGHPGAPMGMAPMANVLFANFLKFNPKDSHWFDRDRFVLSNGHASALLYVMLHLCGYKLSMDDLKSFRQLDSITPGHPERGVTDGVEVTTGPLGQGLSNAVGLAIAEAHFAATFNKPGYNVCDHYTYAFCGDGCLMEGVAMESLSLAGHLGLHKLIVLYDDNSITIDGSTALAFTEDTAAKYAAQGFNIIRVANGDSDYAAIANAIAAAKSQTQKPTIIIVKTTIGKGSKIEGTAKVHGSPLPKDEVAAVKTRFGKDPSKQFFVEEETYDVFRKAGERGAKAQAEWETTLASYAKAFPAEHKALVDSIQGKLPEGWKDKLPRNTNSIATRKASENALAALIPIIPALMGGSADLAPSNLTRPGSAKMVDFQKKSENGRYLRFGVREHGMAGIMNGMQAHGGIIPYGGTFLNFIGYALGSVRLAAMCHHQVVYVATHDSIGVGEDGPTHQPTDLIASLRAMPNMYVMRPADQTETSACWALALESKSTPSCMCLTRQNTTPQPGSSFEGVYKGAYTILEAENPQLVIIATGSEVGIAVEAAKKLSSKLRVRVVSMPVSAVYDAQSDSYKDSILPEGVPTLSVEAFHPMGWDKYSHYHIGMEGWGASAPAELLFKRFGFTVENVMEKGELLVKTFGTNAPPKRKTAGWKIAKL